LELVWRKNPEEKEKVAAHPSTGSPPPRSDPGSGGPPIDAARCFLAGYSTGDNIGDLDHVVFELRSVYDDAS
jgi:hypothetical protein